MLRDIAHDAVEQIAEAVRFEGRARNLAHHLHQARALPRFAEEPRVCDCARELIGDDGEQRKLIVECRGAPALKVQDSTEFSAVASGDADLRGSAGHVLYI